MALEAYRPLVDRFWRDLGVDPLGAQVLRPTATVPPPEDAARAATAGLAQRLEGLGKLHADGVLTDDEFAAAKRRLLES